MTNTKAGARDWRCRFLRMHRWVPRRTEDGRPYEACARCGRDQNDWLGGPGAMGALGGGA